MDVTITLWVLAGSGVASVALFAAKGLLDQLAGVFESWRAAQRAWRGDPPPILELHCSNPTPTAGERPLTR